MNDERRPVNPAHRQVRRGDTDGLPLAPEVVQVEVGLLQNFCELLICPESGEAAVVDPAWEVDRLLREAKQRGVRITSALITHGHHDHVEGIGEMVAHTGATIVVGDREVERVRQVLGGTAGQPGAAGGSVNIQTVTDGELVSVGKRGLRALSTPGHTVGGTCYLADGYVVTGDVLFVGGCGRTDFPGGDTAAMWNSLQRLGALPEETRVYPGHNYGSTATSTIGRELLENPYLRCATFDEFKALRERKRKAT